MFNPISLRKTKIVYNFGLSECNSETLWLHSERPKMYIILAFLSTEGLKEVATKTGYTVHRFSLKGPKWWGHLVDHQIIDL